MRVLLTSLLSISFFWATAQLSVPNGTVTPTTNPATGRVGIGTTSPVSPLEVRVAGDNTQVQTALTILQTNPGSPNGTAGVRLDLGIGNNVNNNGILGRITLKETYWSTQPKMFFSLLDPSSTMQDRLIIDTNGNVGLGVVDPDATLSVYSSISGGHRIKIGDLGSGAKKPSFFLRANADQVNKGYFGMQTAPTGYANDFAIIGADDGGIQRYLHFGYNTGDDPSGTFNPKMSINMYSGNVGIGSTAPDAKLAVKGTVHAQEVKVDLSVPGPDYVFESDYKMPSLSELRNFISQNKHLPEVPSAKELEKDGINVGEMKMLLLKKIEELTLYMLEQQNEVNSLKAEVSALKKQIK